MTDCSAVQNQRVERGGKSYKGIKSHQNLLTAFAGDFFVLRLAPDQGSACTTFVLGEKNHQVFARNYDGEVEEPPVIVNKRGMSKSGYPILAAKGIPHADRKQLSQNTLFKKLHRRGL